MATNKEKLIASAQKLVEKGQFEKAIKEYLKVVAEDDKDVRIWLKIGDLYAKVSKKSEAAETYQKVAQFYSDQGFYLKAVAVYKQILKIEPRLVEVNQRLAELYKQLGLLSDAMQQYEAVAAFFHREGKSKEALAALKQIVELDPETVANRIKLAELYSKDGMAREAIDEFSKAAEQLRQAGRIDDFMKVAERLLFHSPDNRPVTKELAGLYIEKGDPRRALPKLQICFKADPRDTEVLSLLARAFEALDQRQKSVSVLKELARILGENGDARGRDGTWRKILQLAPGDPDAEAALSSPGRARAPSQPQLAATKDDRDDFAVDPPQRGPESRRDPEQRRDNEQRRDSEQRRDNEQREGQRNPTGPAPIGRISNSTGGRPVLMSQSGKVKAVRDEEFDRAARGRHDEGGNVAVKDEPPTRGFATGDDEDPTASSAGSEEEIAKILNETDVYIKYNLHAKAIEHLQRAFERNPQHVGTREKLKALYLILGKKDEAVLELWSLVEHAEPGRKRRYLREILEIDPTNARAAGELGEKLAPTVEEATSGIDELEASRDPEGTNSELLDVDDLEELDDDEFDVSPPSSDNNQRISFEDDDDINGRTVDQPRRPSLTPAPAEDDDLIPVVVEQEREPEQQGGGEVEDRFGFDDSDSSSVEDRFGLDEDDAGAAPMETMPASDSEEHAITDGLAEVARQSSKVAPLRKPITSTTRKRDLLPVEDSDPDIHTRFDDQPLKFDRASLFGTGPEEVDESELPSLPGSGNTRTQQGPPPLDDDLATASEAPSVTRTLLTPAAMIQPDLADSQPQGGSNLEDDLDEADFFVQQSLFEEARSILENLLRRHPHHPLVTAKLRDLEAMELATGVEVVEPTLGPPAPGMSAEMGAELPEDLPGDVDAAPTVGDPVGSFEMTRKGVIEKGVTAEDFETHYDLGIAYKEMGLLDDAVSEFKIVMKDPAREVQCHLMIGLCFLEKGMQTDAIGQFKKGLYVEGITDRESLSMYFELGQAYERLNDPREALYYYDKVMKRDPNFRDVQKRVDELRGGVSAPQVVTESRNDDVDAAFDTLLGKDL